MRRLLSLLSILLSAASFAADGNRLAYLDEPCDPYYVGRDFPKLITPQWVGEEGVEAVVTLAIDDMREPAKYEAYLRPILDRLKKIDGRAPVSIMTCNVKPDDSQIASWLKEGLSIEVHTIDHPCPCLNGDFEKARSTYERGVDLMASIPGNKPVAFRMPCCDSKNTPSPRFWTEIFGRTTAKGNFLTLDSSVFNILTSADPELPREIVLNEKGEERFKRYVPFPSFVNTIENYPYPYVIGGKCWQFPCVTPSDWEAQYVQKPNNPDTVRDLKLALDAIVIKRGVFNLVFHPHGWIRSEQVVELIDHAVSKHGKKVKFLNFRECQERLDKNLLGGHPIRNEEGEDNGVRVCDLNGDGFQDVFQWNSKLPRIWLPKENQWAVAGFQFDGNVRAFQIRAGVMDKKGRTLVALSAADGAEPLSFSHDQISLKEGVSQFPSGKHDTWLKIGFRFRDLDGDGICELLPEKPSDLKVLRWDTEKSEWIELPYGLPGKISLLTADGKDAGARFVDINGDGRADLLYADGKRYAAYLWNSIEHGWIRLFDGQHGDGRSPSLPPFVRSDGTNNGVWFHSKHIWWQNEETASLPDGVDRRSFTEIAAPAQAAAKPNDYPTTLIGAARIDITPDYPVRLTGYGARTQEATEVERKIHARALAIGGKVGAASELSVLLSVDNCGVSAAIRADVAKALADKGGLQPERLAICSSHTHCAPMANGFAPMIFGAPPPPEHQAHIDRYTKELTEKLIKVALEAIAARKPGKLLYGLGEVKFAANRRALKDGKWQGFGVMPTSPVDHRLAVLAARDADDKLVAVLSNYACHCTTLNGDFNKIHPDWAGVACDKLEQDLAGCIALQAIGCGADSNPNPRGTVALVEQHGNELAAEVRRVLGGKMQPIDPRIVCQFETIELPFDKLPTVDQWQSQATKPGAAGYHAKHFLLRLEKQEKLPTTVTLPVASWQFGSDLGMVFLGGEVVVDYAIRLRGLNDPDRLWINAYSNDVPCYIASKRVLLEGGYEADSSMIYYARPTRLAPAAEDLVVETVQKQIGKTFAAKPAPPKPDAAKQAANDFPEALSEVDALKSIVVRAGLKVELVAGDDLVQDPVAFDWGPDGTLWVVEMADYPLGIDGKGKPGGRVKRLVDKNGDGKYDTGTTFLQDIPYPTGVKAWRKGVLVSAAPHVFYAEDIDGDGVAEKREILYEGFGEGNQQHRVNGLRWGADGWLYLGNGDSGGKIQSKKTGEAVNISGRDLRIRPDEGLLDPQSGQTQYGRAVDDWGNWFGGNNSNPLWHYVLEDHYLRRNPHVASPPARLNVPEQPGAAPVFPISHTLTRFNDFHTKNHFTSACSPEIYRDDYLGAEFIGNSFVCEPVHNLIHREILTANGLTFSSRRADDEKESEFLASRDNWFRPVMIRTGPDGALWVADMYRHVIEHPQWIPKEWQAKLNLRAGEDRGRIYRIVRTDKPPRPLPKLHSLSGSELVAALDSPNGWTRDMVQQMLVWKGDKSSADALAKLAASSTRPQSRLQALATLELLGAITPESIIRALSDEHPGVRRGAVRLAEKRVPLEAIARLAEDADPRVRQQVAYSVGEWPEAAGGKLLAKLLLRNSKDASLTAAAISSLHSGNVAQAVTAVLAAGGTPPADMIDKLFSVWTSIAGPSATSEALALILGNADKPAEEWQFLAEAALLDSLARRQTSLDSLPLQASLKERWTKRRASLLQEMADAKPGVALRVAMTKVVGRSSASPSELDALASLLDAKQPVALQLAAVEALERTGHGSVPARLLQAWPAHGPSVRARAMDALLGRPSWTEAVLEGVAQGKLGRQEIDARRRAQLLRVADPAIRAKAEKLFAAEGDVDRKKIVAAHQSVLAMKGEVERGKALFKKKCATCHRFNGEGQLVGPEIAAVKDRSPQTLLIALLDPNRAIEDRYLDYAVTTTDGRILTGLIGDESAGSITLVGPDDKQVVVLRKDIEAIRSSGKSLMPEGLEKDFQPQDFADLLAYVALINPPKEFAGNTPATIRPAADGSLAAPAASARIYGPRIILESQYKNLGWWSSEEDRAEWTLVIATPGKYAVALDYACDRTSAGNELTVSAAGKSLRGKVAASGTWDDYRTWELGTLELPAGEVTLVIRSAGPIQGALIDLRGLKLTPVK